MEEKKALNLTMLADFYEFTMANGFFGSGMQNAVACFDMFFRRVPDGGGYAIAAGLSGLIEFIKSIEFSKEDIDYLRGKKIFSEEFLSYLENFEFTCDVYAVEEGTPVFPGEPLVCVVGPCVQAQLIETMLLLHINHQSLIATKASRICRAAQGRDVLEFGARRAHGASGAINGSRGAFIGGCIGTSCTISEEMFSFPALGTMAHSWIQLFDSEYEAFKAYAKCYPDTSTLLIDTYNVLKSGVPNAIRVQKEVLDPLGCKLRGVRIDSGDVVTLSKEVRKALDEAGMEETKICVSDSLDEYKIREFLERGACIDIFGVGERLITSKSEPVFGGVYKLAALWKNGEMIPKIKISENAEKITNPGFKQLYRLFDKKSNMALCDVILLHEEEISGETEYELFDVNDGSIIKKACNFKAEKLLKPVFINGKQMYDEPALVNIRENCQKQLSLIEDGVKRFENPAKYCVGLSEKLWEIKKELLRKQSH